MSSLHVFIDELYYFNFAEKSQSGKFDMSFGDEADENSNVSNVSHNFWSFMLTPSTLFAYGQQLLNVISFIFVCFPKSRALKYRGQLDINYHCLMFQVFLTWSSLIDPRDLSEK